MDPDQTCNPPKHSQKLLEEAVYVRASLFLWCQPYAKLTQQLQSHSNNVIIKSILYYVNIPSWEISHTPIKIQSVIDYFAHPLNVSSIKQFIHIWIKINLQINLKLLRRNCASSSIIRKRFSISRWHCQISILNLPFYEWNNHLVQI